MRSPAYCPVALGAVTVGSRCLYQVTEVAMTQQAVIEATPAEPELAGEEAVDRAGEEALIADELLVEEVSIDGMCGVY
jgi:mycofactocin precursor